MAKQGKTTSTDWGNYSSPDEAKIAKNIRDSGAENLPYNVGEILVDVSDGRKEGVREPKHSNLRDDLPHHPFGNPPT